MSSLQPFTKNKSRSSTVVVTAILYIILAITVFIVLYPVAFTIGAAFTETNSLAATSIVPWPKKPSLYQFRRLLTPSDQIVKGTENVRGTNYFVWYRNTLKIAVMNTLLTLAICVTAGYIFSRFRFAGRKPIMASMIVLQMFPSFIGMIAVYFLLLRIGGHDSHWGLVLIYATGGIPYNSWLMKGYFDTVSRSIDEAARVDGASPLTTFVKIIIPMAKPMIMFLALTSFTGPWMDFIFPRLILSSNKQKTLAVGLFEMINGRANDNFTMFAAGALLVAIPFAILFMLGQNMMLQSLAGDGVKE